MFFNEKFCRFLDLLSRYDSASLQDFISFLHSTNVSEDDSMLHWVLAKVPRVSYCKPAVELYSLVTGKSEEHTLNFFERESKILPATNFQNSVPLDQFTFIASKKVFLGLTIETIIESDSEGVILSKSDNTQEIKFESSNWVSEMKVIDGVLYSETIYFPKDFSEKGKLTISYRI